MPGARSSTGSVIGSHTISTRPCTRSSRSWTTGTGNNRSAPRPGGRRSVPPADGRGDRIQLGQLHCAEIDRGRGDVLLQVLSPLSSGNREDVIPLREQPGDGDLGWRYSSPRCHRPHGLHDPLVLRDFFLPKSWQRRTKVVRVESAIRRNGSGQKASSERRERDE